MTGLRTAIAEYLELRRALGFRLTKDEKLLEDFAVFMERRHATHTTAKLAAKWAQQPASTDANYHAGRLRAVRSFARYRILTDPRTKIPPTDLLPRQRSAFQPHIFTGDEIGRILAASLRPWGGATQFYCLCHYTIYGLLSVTGMRVSEALNLDVDDVDLVSGVITIRNAKFGKSRFVPLHETTRAALEAYRARRDVHLAGRKVDAFFISVPGRRIIPSVLDRAFRRLTRRLGMREATGPVGPRLHDLRHTMAIEVLRRCYSTGADPERRLPALSTYLGHTHLNYTYWYLHQNPELMTEAMARLQHRWEASA
ncbi:tyrosine-type recombinase/integrase [Xanthobacter autotrophicus]|uniref:tyrosine-type recombinase/integrase n=1 Tax=Xanthobacter autotrophicus TaxID=280 RepID=UPI0037286A4F